MPNEIQGFLGLSAVVFSLHPPSIGIRVEDGNAVDVFDEAKFKIAAETVHEDNSEVKISESAETDEELCTDDETLENMKI